MFYIDRMNLLFGTESVAFSKIHLRRLLRPQQQEATILVSLARGTIQQEARKWTKYP